MRRRVAVALALALSAVLVAGCLGSTPFGPPKTWDIRALSWLESTRVHDSTGYFYYEADPGYTWLGFDLRVRNRRNEQSCFNELVDHFIYVIGTQRYSRQLLFADLHFPNLPSCYQPGQTKEGYVFFEVPQGSTPPTGTLLFEGWSLGDSDGQTVTISVAGLPRSQ